MYAIVVELWWEYQKSILPAKAMERLGTTAILENIGNYAAPIIKDLFAEADFITKRNSRAAYGLITQI